jgi:hypothetical protein
MTAAPIRAVAIPDHMLTFRNVLTANNLAFAQMEGLERSSHIFLSYHG